MLVPNGRNCPKQGVSLTEIIRHVVRISYSTSGSETEALLLRPLRLFNGFEQHRGSLNVGESSLGHNSLRFFDQREGSRDNAAQRACDGG